MESSILFARPARGHDWFARRLPEEIAMSPIPQQLGLPPAAQLGFVVRDMDASLKLYAPLFGPMHVVEFENHDFDYRGGKASCELRVAYGWTGEVEVELIQPLSGGTPHREFLDAGHEGLHHLQYRYDDISDCEKKLREAGCSYVWGKRQGGYAFAYYESPTLPLMIELVQPQARRRDHRAEGRVVFK
jgi:methylmalonyl-CoA/ethylmalonyl-CoA epimerase